MDTTSVLHAGKARGRLRLLPEDLEQDLTDRYYGLNGKAAEPATDLAKAYAPFSRTQSITANGVRMIAQRVLRSRGMKSGEVTP